MQKHINKIASTAAGFGLFLIGCVTAGLGLVVVFYLALFALVVGALGVLALPLLNLMGRAAADDEDTATA